MESTMYVLIKYAFIFRVSLKGGPGQCQMTQGEQEKQAYEGKGK